MRYDLDWNFRLAHDSTMAIIDVHSHVWRYPDHFNDDFRQQAKRARAGVEVDLTVRYEDYAQLSVPDVKTIVFGGKARLSGVWVDDRYVADCVAQHPDTLIGFLSVDPTQDGWERELRDGHEVLGLRGIKLLSMYAGFRPMTNGSIRCGRMPPNDGCQSCCTRGRRSSPRLRWSARCRGTSTASPRGSRRSS
jgi:hypothetical protein